MAGKKAGKKSLAEGLVEDIVISGIDEILAIAAEALASIVPKNNTLVDSLLARYLFTFLKNQLEEKGDQMSPILRTAMERVTKTLDVFRGARGAGAGSKGKEAGQKVSGWFDAFFREASKRLAKAPDPNAEMARLRLEFQLRTQLLQLFQQWEAQQQAAQQQAAQQPGPEFDWSAFLAGVQARWRIVDEKAKRAAGAVDQATGVVRGINQKLPFRVF